MYPVAPACLILFPKCMRHFSLLIIGFARRAQIARARGTQPCDNEQSIQKSSAFDRDVFYVAPPTRSILTADF